jgi:hypothetical protein
MALALTPSRLALAETHHPPQPPACNTPLPRFVSLGTTEVVWVTSGAGDRELRRWTGMAAWRTDGEARMRWDTRGTRVGEGRMVGSEVQVVGVRGTVVVWCSLSWLSCSWLSCMTAKNCLC